MKKKRVKRIWNVWKNEALNPETLITYNLAPKIDQAASLFSAGNYYYYILNFRNLEISYAHPNTAKILGLKPDLFSLDTFFDIMHPEDLDKMYKKELKASHFLLKNIPIQNRSLYKISYLIRLRHTDGTYKTILHQARTLSFSRKNKIEQVIVTHTDVTYLNLPIDHKISFISETAPSYYAVETETSYKEIDNRFKNLFTKREVQIIQKVSEGNSFNEIAVALNISPHTINTHKRNVLKKTQCRNTAELLAKCIREGII